MQQQHETRARKNEFLTDQPDERPAEVFPGSWVNIRRVRPAYTARDWERDLRLIATRRDIPRDHRIPTLVKILRDPDGEVYDQATIDARMHAQFPHTQEASDGRHDAPARAQRPSRHTRPERGRATPTRNHLPENFGMEFLFE